MAHHLLPFFCVISSDDWKRYRQHGCYIQNRKETIYSDEERVGSEKGWDRAKRDADFSIMKLGKCKIPTSKYKLLIICHTLPYHDLLIQKAVNLIPQKYFKF